MTKIRLAFLDSTRNRFGRTVGSVLLVGVLLTTLNGCALFGGKKTSNPSDAEIAAEQEKQDEDLGEFVASYGRANPKEKKKVDPGQTFLFSSKAKEIYANTER